MADNPTPATPQQEPAPAPAQNPAPAPAPTFTQEQVDKMIGERVARALKGMVSAENLATITQERDTSKTQLDAANASLKEVTEKLNRYEHERLLLSKGIPAEDVDYYEFKISKMVNDKTTFEQAVEEYLKDNGPGRVRVDLTAPLGGGSHQKSANDMMNALIRGARK